VTGGQREIKASLWNLFNIFCHDTRRRRRRSPAFGASVKDFERDIKGKLFQKFSLKRMKALKAPRPARAA